MNYKLASDIELWHCCQKDDIRAYNVLFDRYVGKMHRMGLRYLKDQYAVEELTTDILLNIWLRRHEINLEGKLSSYLFQAMHNKAISFLRKPAPVTVDIEAFSDDEFISNATADQLITLKDAEITLEERLAQLSPQRQKVFRLSREKNMSYAEIADEMGISQNTVKHHMNAALSYLRQQYQGINITAPTIIILLLPSGLYF
jgi:RNA polymerase sigma-70 factor (ECF subfamily)